MSDNGFYVKFSLSLLPYRVRAQRVTRFFSCRKQNNNRPYTTMSDLYLLSRLIMVNQFYYLQDAVWKKFTLKSPSLDPSGTWTSEVELRLERARPALLQPNTG
ncbi:MAG: hypothetical protein D3910_01005 [Candidatus Electrothrix sp. ATG2]|nr:hypothetical protein [Candidatus Electrothrix sp. ATG2]